MGIKEITEEQIFNMCLQIKMLRIEKGLSVKDLSEQTRIPVVLIEEIENCVVSDRFLIEHLLSLCYFFDKKPSDFFNRFN